MRRKNEEAFIKLCGFVEAYGLKIYQRFNRFSCISLHKILPIIITQHFQVFLRLGSRGR